MGQWVLQKMLPGCAARRRWGLRRDVRLLLEALAAAFVLCCCGQRAVCPLGLGVPGAGYVLLGSAVPFLWAVLMVALAECARIAERDEGTVCGAAFVAMLALMMVETGLGVSGLAVLPGALAGALVALLLWAFPPARLGAGCCGSLLAAGAIGCIPLSLDMTSLTVPLALPFWAAGGLWQRSCCVQSAPASPALLGKKHKMSPETVFLCSFALSAVGWCWRWRCCAGADRAQRGKGAQMATIRKKHRAPVSVFQRDPGPWSRLLIDWLATLAVIMIFGLVMLFSASYTTGYLRMGDSFHYIKQQALCMILVGWAVCS